MTQETITAVLSILSTILIGVFGWMLRRFVKDYDDKHKTSNEKIEEIEVIVTDNNRNVCDRVLTIEQKIPTLQLANTQLNTSMESYNKQWSAKQTEIMNKIDMLVSKEQWNELKEGLKELTGTLNKFLIAQGETNIKIQQLEKQTDELVKYHNNQKIKDNKNGKN